MSYPSQATPTLPPLRPRPTMGLGAILIGKEEEELVTQVVRSGRLFRYSYDLPAEEQGPMAATLEAEFREMVGTRYALAVTSGTAALEVALGALGVGPGDEVIVPNWSWVSCFTAVVRLGALPVLAEVDESLCLAPGEITRLCNERTRAVLVVHYQGAAAEMDQIMEEAHEAGIAVLEDCAESTGAFYKGRRVGSIGDIGIYSFQFQKMMTSGEGGMVVTNTPALYERAVRFHDLGNIRPHHHQHVEPRLEWFAGSQFRMNELTAAAALAQRRKVDATRDHCRKLSLRIIEQINDLPGLTLRHLPDPEGDNGIEIYFYLTTPELTDRFTAALNTRNVNCGRMTGTYCHTAKPYCEKGLAHAPGASPFRQFETLPAPGYRVGDFPKTESLAQRFVALPMGVRYTVEDADYIAQTVRALHAEIVLPEVEALATRA